MTWLASFLANKVVAPLALVGCLLFAVFGAWQYVAKNNCRSDLSALQAQNLQAKLDHANAVIKENAVRVASLEAQNGEWAKKYAALQVQKQHYTPQEVIRYVPQNVARACVPVSLLMLLDAAGTGADLSTVAPAPGESADACSKMDLPAATAAIMQNAAFIPELAGRIENAREAWEAQRRIGFGQGQYGVEK